MSTNSTPPAVPLDTGVPAFTPTANSQLADDLMAMLAQFEAKLPHFEQKHPSTVPFVRAHRFVPAAFLGSTINAVAENPALQGVNKLDPTEGREVLQFLEAFSAVRQKLLSLANAVSFTMEARRAALAASCLQVYSIAKGVVRDPGSADLVDHIATMEQDLGRTRVKKRVKKPGSGGSPASPPVTPAPASTPAPTSSTNPK